MSKGQTLRALVNERLAAAAEEIFVLIERTIVEYEEELCRYKQENQKKQQLLDKVLYPRIELVRGNVQIPSTSPSPGLSQKTTQTPWIKEEPEEQSVKQEEEQLPVSVPESSAVCVKTEESSLLQQRQTEHREETQGEDISSEPHVHSETEGHTEHSPDNDDDCKPHCSSAAQMETETDGDPDNQVQIRDRSIKLSPQNKSGPETTVHSGHMSGASGAERKRPQCHLCNKTFKTNQTLQVHIRLHTGERPFSCSFCERTFNNKEHRIRHERTHTGEKPYSCSFCEKTFADPNVLKSHERTHTGEKPFSCPTCQKPFADHSCFKRHLRTHTGEKPYTCSVCNKSFAVKRTLQSHTRTHTGEEPHGCSTCEKRFADKRSLNLHLKMHKTIKIKFFKGPQNNKHRR